MKKVEATDLFKIQISFETPPMVLIYNEDESIMGQYPANKEILKLMKGKKKAYFWGYLPKGSTIIELNPKQIKDQDW